MKIDRHPHLNVLFKIEGREGMYITGIRLWWIVILLVVIGVVGKIESWEE